MADQSDIELVLHAKTDEVAKSTEELIKLIDSLSSSVDGMDGAAAKQLKDQLNELADIIKGMDISKLKSLDNILQRLKETKVNLTPEGIDKVGEQLDKIEKKAKETKSQIEELGLNVNVEKSGDAEEDRGRKLDAMGNAEALVGQIKAYRDALQGIPGDYDDIIQKLNVLEIEAKNAGPDTMDKFKSATDEVGKAFDKLGSKGQTAVAGIQKTITGLSASLNNNIKRPVQEISGTSTETFSGANAMSALLKGNFDSIGSQMMDLLKKTKLWEGALNGAGGKVGVVGAAFALAMFGISKAVEGVKRTIASLKAERRAEEQRFWDMQFSDGDAAKTAMDILERKRQAQSRSISVRDATKGADRATRDANIEAENARLDAVRQLALAGNFNAGSVERIETEYEDTMSDRGFAKEQNALNDQITDLNDKRDDIKKQIAMTEETAGKMRQYSRTVGRALDEALKNGEDIDSYWSQVGQNFADIFGGRSQEEVMEDAKKYIEQGKSVQQMIYDYQQQLGKDIRDKEAELEAANQELRGAKANAAAINAKHDAELEKRRARKKRIDHERRMENEEKDRSDYLYNRDMAEEEAERKYSRENEKSDQATKVANAEKRLAERKAKYESVYKAYEELMNANAGKDERDWSDRAKVQRARLEEDMAHYRQLMKASEDEVYGLKRDDGSSEYSRARSLAVERRDEMEANRAQIRAWRTKRGGAAGREADAASEYQYQSKMLEDRKRLLDSFVASAGGKNGYLTDGQLAKLTAAQRQKYEDLRSDVVSSRGNVRSARSAYMDAMWEGNQRAVDFRNGLKESNRLTSMGLAGGGTMKWGTDTANNTKEMVRLYREFIREFKGNKQSMKSDGSVYSF